MANGLSDGQIAYANQKKRENAIYFEIAAYHRQVLLRRWFVFSPHTIAQIRIGGVSQ
jgi:hypothetical protein